MKTAANLNTAIQNFVMAHDRYLELDRVRTECSRPSEREMVHIEILKAYLEVQVRARVVAGLQYADGMDFADAN
jgi:hypothetical protein